MNSVFARALVSLILLALPTLAHASTKSDKAKHEAKADHAKPARPHPLLAKKDQPAKKAKHHGHKPKEHKEPAAAEPGLSAKAH